MLCIKRVVNTAHRSTTTAVGLGITSDNFRLTNICATQPHNRHERTHCDLLAAVLQQNAWIPFRTKHWFPIITFATIHDRHRHHLFFSRGFAVTLSITIQNYRL